MPAASVIEAPISQAVPAAKGCVRGQVSGFRERSEANWPVWSFGLDTYDEHGGLGRRYAVELRGAPLHGVIRDGHLVEIDTSRRRGEILTPLEVNNLTTGSVAGVNQAARKVGWIFLCIFLLFFFCVLGWIVWGVSHMFRSAHMQERSAVEIAKKGVQFHGNTLTSFQNSPAGVRVSVLHELTRAKNELRQVEATLKARGPGAR